MSFISSSICAKDMFSLKNKIESYIFFKWTQVFSRNLNLLQQWNRRYVLHTYLVLNSITILNTPYMTNSTLVEYGWNFDQNYKFSNKNNMMSAWRNFENIFARPLFIIIFRPEMLKFHPYSILTGTPELNSSYTAC